MKKITTVFAALISLIQTSHPVLITVSLLSTKTFDPGKALPRMKEP